VLFNSYEFLFLFLPIVLFGYYIAVPRRFRLGFLAVMSYLFYGWWDYRFCSLLLISTVVDYIAGKNIDATAIRGRRKFWLCVSLVTNLSLLGFFKYWDLVAQTLNDVLGFLPFTNEPIIPILGIVLPVGISFYTFQSMSYSIDIYMGEAKPARNFQSFACYVALFPQLIAGPIVRYRELAEQLVQRSHTWNKAALGVTFFVMGLVKKVIVADSVAPLVDHVFGMSAPGLLASWTGILAYAVQIYYDFSGYSDMAVGLGFLFGFTFPQNFHSPYKAISITDFWRRWHISLSTWLRDYLYIPLGGNRKGAGRTYMNLFTTMLLGGLWHGASWTFVLWGGYHGTLLALERAAGKKSLLARTPAAFQRGFTFVLVLVGWVLFRCESLAQAGALLAGMCGMHGAGTWAAMFGDMLPFAPWMLAGALLVAFFAPNTWEIKWKQGFWIGCLLCALFVLCVMVILINSSSPFLYFQF
jgi:alginate O-acetyltransferase complex protein AlgI